MSARRKSLAGGARPSIRDVARHAGVSPGCVSNVINGRRKQDDAIGRAVLTAVDELGYRRNTMASNLRRNQSRIIGLVIPDFENPFFAELVAQLERCAEATSYRIVATSSREDADIEAREIDELVGWRVAGILLVPSLHSRAARSVGTGETPFVLLDRVAEGAACDAIGVNNVEACADVMRRLIALGHRRILVAYLGDGIANVSERLEGVRQAAAEASDDVTVDYVATGDPIEAARAALGRYFDTSPEVDAVFCLFNTATLAAYGLMQERGMAPGDRTALVGFDDSAWMANVFPPVAAIVQPIREIADQAWARLLARVEGDEHSHTVLRVPCHFEARSSLVGSANGTESRNTSAVRVVASGERGVDRSAR